MRSLRLVFPMMLMLASLPACKGKAEAPKPVAPAPPAATTAPPATTPPATTPAATAPPETAPPATTAPPETPPPADEGIGAAKYPVCAGTGGNAGQLSPAFLDKMPGCEAPDTAAADKLSEVAGDGTIIEGKGDCQFAAGISCHFHTAQEFVNSGTAQSADSTVGEMHCIVPSGDANSPTVFGAHLKCKEGTSLDSGSKMCSKDLLSVLANANCHGGWKCCDNGTLTKPVGKQSDGEKKLRPDFRICQDEAIEVDCGLLHGMHGHTANLAGVGEEVNGKFLPGDAHAEAPAPAPDGTAPAPAPAPAAADTEGIGAPHYAVCAGQGGEAAQLSPAFLDKMPACEAPDTAPADKLAEVAGDGSIIEGKGDCQYNGGISCHFHTSMEFVTSSKLKDDENAVGEMHCIVPSADANSPTVFGAHLKCKAGTSLENGTKMCSHELIAVLANANCHEGWKCCDNGTLTKPVGKQSDDEKKLRPDFRICQEEAIEVDCGLLHGMHGHTANVAGLGEEINGKFNAGDEAEHH